MPKGSARTPLGPILLVLNKFFGDMPLGHQPLYCTFDDINMRHEDKTRNKAEKLETWAEYQDQLLMLITNSKV